MNRKLLAILLCGVACGPPADPVKAYEVVWRASCDKVVECVDEAAEPTWDWVQTRLDECAASGTTDESWAASVRSGVESGAIIYDRDEAKACLDAYKESDCIFFWEAPPNPSCEDYLRGTVECAEACEVHEACESGVCRAGLCDCSE
jgi:hypothetical protein